MKIKEYKGIDLQGFQIHELYYKLIDLAQNTEENRLGRFNSLLIINAILLAAWASLIVAAIGNGYIRVAEVLLCVVGFVLSIIWAFVGEGTSRYHKYYIDNVKAIEENFLPEGIMPKIMTEADASARGGKEDRTTKILVGVPILFAFVFLVLAVISIILSNSCR